VIVTWARRACTGAGGGAGREAHAW
jgi:hypothetical protein